MYNHTAAFNPPPLESRISKQRSDDIPTSKSYEDVLVNAVENHSRRGFAPRREERAKTTRKQRSGEGAMKPMRAGTGARMRGVASGGD
jgi:hypothetical protein